jgi:nucleoside-diphosphate-sugar epimerase
MWRFANAKAVPSMAIHTPSSVSIAAELAASEADLPAVSGAIHTVGQLDDALSEPTPELVEMMSRIEGPIIVLGVGGKMGPTLSKMIRRADEQAGIDRRVIGVSRFGSGSLQPKLNEWGIETIAADLLSADDLTGLPDVPNVIFMAGLKFGATGNESLTWAMNAILPAMVCQKYAQSRIVAFSTGNLYPPRALTAGGSSESDPLGPIGEYSMSCLGRERVFEHYSRTAGTPVSLIRLSYACELRYGVLVDIARSVWERRPVNIANGCFTVIWQRDANAMSLRALEHAASPPFVLNVAGPEVISVRRVATEIGQIMGREVSFTGQESDVVRINNGQLGHRMFGYPRVSVQEMLRQVAGWVMHGGADLGKPTHFEVRDGRY